MLVVPFPTIVTIPDTAPTVATAGLVLLYVRTTVPVYEGLVIKLPGIVKVSLVYRR
jgi:hypothetical protein